MNYTFFKLTLSAALIFFSNTVANASSNACYKKDWVTNGVYYGNTVFCLSGRNIKVNHYLSKAWTETEEETCQVTLRVDGNAEISQFSWGKVDAPCVTKNGVVSKPYGLNNVSCSKNDQKLKCKWATTEFQMDKMPEKEAQRELAFILPSGSKPKKSYVNVFNCAGSYRDANIQYAQAVWEVYLSGDQQSFRTMLSRVGGSHTKCHLIEMPRSLKGNEDLKYLGEISGGQHAGSKLWGFESTGMGGHAIIVLREQR